MTRPSRSWALHLGHFGCSLRRSDGVRTTEWHCGQATRIESDAVAALVFILGQVSGPVSQEVLACAGRFQRGRPAPLAWAAPRPHFSGSIEAYGDSWNIRTITKFW